MDKTYRIGIVGAGFGVSSHLPALVAHPRFEVVALASPSSAAKIAQERNIPHAFASCEEMLAGCELDAVTIAGPPFTHHRDVLASLAAGKHVMCEKPFALNVREAEEMVAAAHKAGTACGIAHEFRFVPQRAAIKELVVNGHLNPLRNIELTHLLGRLRVDENRPRGWWFEHARGGGAAGAWLSHLVDSATWIAGRPPERVTGFIRTANPHRRDAGGAFTSTVDDGAFATIDYGNGLVGRVSVDATLNVESFTVAAHGEHRTAIASGTDIVDMTLFSVDNEETNELQCKPSPYAKFTSINANVPLLMELYDEFVKQIETGASALPSFDEGLDTQRVLAEIGYSV